MRSPEARRCGPLTRVIGRFGTCRTGHRRSVEPQPEHRVATGFRPTDKGGALQPRLSRFALNQAYRLLRHFVLSGSNARDSGTCLDIQSGTPGGHPMTPPRFLFPPPSMPLRATLTGLSAASTRSQWPTRSPIPGGPSCSHSPRPGGGEFPGGGERLTMAAAPPHSKFAASSVLPVPIQRATSG